jgi:tripartite-type tricarboxylate transporter receptor subunit TctC
MIPQALSAFRAMLCLLLVASANGLAQPVSAQTFPTQTITFQVAFAAGGIADVVARLVGQRLSERLAHTVVVENRGGAGGNLAAKAVSGAAPDGHTILATTTSLAVNETARGCITTSPHVALRPILSALPPSTSVARIP